MGFPASSWVKTDPIWEKKSVDIIEGERKERTVDWSHLTSQTPPKYVTML